MEQQFKDWLQSCGLNAQQVDKLEEADFQTVYEIACSDVTTIMRITGCKEGTAVRIFNKCKETLQQQSSISEESELGELLKLFAGGERKKKLISAIKTIIRDYPQCLVVTDDVLDCESSVYCFNYMVNSGVAFPNFDGIPLKTIDDILEDENQDAFEADPMNGELLVRGKATSDGLDWSNVPKDKRIFMAFICQQGILPEGVDRFTLVDELIALDFKKPIQRWRLSVGKYKEAQRKDKKAILSAEESLVFKKGGRSGKGKQSFR